MSFKEWLLSSYPNPDIAGQWKPLHIIVLISAIAITIAIPFIVKLFKNKERARKIISWILVGLILTFEISRRIINLYKMTDHSLDNYLYHLLPRPWCAISCWSLIIAKIANKKFLYNFASITSLLCALIFFAYPAAGFNNQYVLFDNLYSIGTHTLLLITSISLITLRLTDFRYADFWKIAVCYAVIYGYAFFEMYVLKISDDPLYFMPHNDVQEILSLNYPLFLAIYILFIILYTNIFHVINDWKKVKTVLPKRKQA